MSAAEHFRHVYAERTEEYDRLVRAEDVDGELWRALDELVDWSDRTVVELGVGTGRITVPLARRAARIEGFDLSEPMMAIARRHVDEARGAQRLAEVRLRVAEHRSLPLPDHGADALIEGWAVAHYVDWDPDGWRRALDDAVTEAHRVLRPGSPIVLVETLGTGSTTPRPPTEELGLLYEHLQDVHGFLGTSIRTDYAFADRREAVEVVGGFFGNEMLPALQDADDGTVRLPECTGIWSARTEQ